jgi:hypothetical protein
LGLVAFCVWVVFSIVVLVWAECLSHTLYMDSMYRSVGVGVEDHS